MSATPRARSLAVLPILIVAFLVAGLLVVAPPADAAMTRSQRVVNALHIVRDQKGDAYSYGSAGPDRFDCSGLVYFSFRKAGFTNIPRTSDAQARFVDRIKKRNMRPGDLMFFYDGGGVYHVAVYGGRLNGRRMMVHAPYGGQRVHRTSPWTDQWFAGTLR